MNNKTWYSTKIIYRSQVEGSLEPPIEDTSIRLFRASDLEEAGILALEIGQAGERSYLNVNGQTVLWQFKEVVEIQDLCETNIYDGMEVFSTLDWSNHA